MYWISKLIFETYLSFTFSFFRNDIFYTFYIKYKFSPLFITMRMNMNSRSNTFFVDLSSRVLRFMIGYKSNFPTKDDHKDCIVECVVFLGYLQSFCNFNSLWMGHMWSKEIQISKEIYLFRAKNDNYTKYIVVYGGR